MENGQLHQVVFDLDTSRQQIDSSLKRK